MSLAVLTNGNGTSESMPYRYVAPESLTLSGIKADNGLTYVIAHSTDNYSNMKIIEK